MQSEDNGWLGLPDRVGCGSGQEQIAAGQRKWAMQRIRYFYVCCAVVILYLVQSACTGGAGSRSFPFSGPGCTGAAYSDACWTCQVRNCNAGCLATDCAAYYECACACPASDLDNCSAECAYGQACLSCFHGLTGGRDYGDCKACAAECSPQTQGDASPPDAASVGDGSPGQ
jgi:hypothetical protein